MMKDFVLYSAPGSHYWGTTLKETTSYKGEKKLNRSSRPVASLDTEELKGVTTAKHQEMIDLTLGWQ